MQSIIGDFHQTYGTDRAVVSDTKVIDFLVWSAVSHLSIVFANKRIELRSWPGRVSSAGVRAKWPACRPFARRWANKCLH